MRVMGSSRFVAKDGRAVLLRPAIEEDASQLIQAMDSVARDGVCFVPQASLLPAEGTRGEA